MNKKGDLLHHSIIYKILSSLLYLIAYPILFLLTKIWMGLKIEGREKDSGTLAGMSVRAAVDAAERQPCRRGRIQRFRTVWLFCI